LRGHFLGHWLSAASRTVAVTGDGELTARVARVVADLGRCQEANGGEWVASIPESYLHWIARGRGCWAPHYTIHKTLMGLLHAYQYSANEEALSIVQRAAAWFVRWTVGLSREQLADILDVETGGMLEVWADLYAITGDPQHAELLARYGRWRLFERLLAGEDPLTNRHANTTIPEVHGAARAYEVTGDERWRRVVEAYWRCAVTDRGTFCTGGQTSGEIWTAPFAWAARLGEKTQEHCTVYNMIRLADSLFRWTGEAHYADYIERNLYNGVLAQQHPHTGAISYFLPLEPGAQKHWGSETNDFWCCHGTLVQAHAMHDAVIYYAAAGALTVCQYIPSTLNWECEGAKVGVSQELNPMACNVQSFVQEGQQDVTLKEALSRPDAWNVALTVQCDPPREFDVRLRLPGWLAGDAILTVDGVAETLPASGPGFHTLRRLWSGSTSIHLSLPKALTACPIPDAPEMVAFMEGPIVLAGLCDEERALVGDPAKPETILAPANEREWGVWLNNWRTVHQDRRLDFKPLYEIIDQRYTVYFPVRPARS